MNRRSAHVFIMIFVLISIFCNPQPIYAQIITTYAGIGPTGPVGSYGGDGGPATLAGLSGPRGVTLDSAGNLYIGDYYNNRIRKVNASGIISTFAGDGINGFAGDGGAATAAKLFTQGGSAIDRRGNLYILDAGTRIRKIDTAGIITTIAGTGTAGYSGDGGQATAAEIGPNDVAIDTTGNIYIATSGNVIRKINTSGIITTVAGNGTPGYSGDGGQATAAKIQPEGVATDRAGNLYINDQTRIRMVSTSGIITTIAGNGIMGYSGDGGPALAAQFTSPHGITVDDTGNVYLADTNNERIRKISATGIVTTIAGNGVQGYDGDGGPPDSAALDKPEYIAVAKNGDIFFSDGVNHRIRKIKHNTLHVNTIHETHPDIQVYPNPVNSDQFTLTFPPDTHDEAHIIITNMAGEQIKEMTTTTNGPTDLRLNAAPGIYFLSAVTAHNSWNVKLVITR